MAIALDRVFPTAGSRREAAKAISDSLLSGTMAARGRPVTLSEPEISGRERRLVDLASPTRERMFGDIVDIPRSFWSATDDIAAWDGSHDYFSDLSNDEVIQYAEVSVREKDVNALIKRRQPEAEKPQTQERRRQPSWEQWVAAVVSLAHEHQIKANMKQKDLLGLVTARLQRWNLDEMPTSTVGPAARAIQDRYRSDPPADPLDLKGAPERKP